MKTCLLCFALILISPSTRAEVLHLSESGFILQNEFTTQASADRVWDGLINHIGDWWPADHTWFGKAENLSIEPVAGGCFCEIDGDKQAEHMRISFVYPGKHLRMTGGLGPLQGMGLYGSLDWQIAPTDSGTRVTLKYSVQGYNPNGFTDLAPIVDKVQGLQLGGLEEFLKLK
ncbi:hypothetical protein HMF8227_00964 [Saliniradius amylolyticus]|uniref:Polyketide cyclase/dehydrase n=1 Tax=Saliniradius amylolyticus TaxID=2183582 RepID=A0A2S2E368_9ALTE|nr:polyketide cyclase/dehydrase [Saliniradius amylolyticus]AWL11457.1 hypothetical protein HMF8227_00964 [Saliniradius amylolyticus]